MDKGIEDAKIFSLLSMKKLMEKLENPQDSLKTIHITGTSGKEDVGTYMESVLKEAGYRVGRWISSVAGNSKEKIRVNGICISDEDFIRLMEKVKKIVENMKEDKKQIPSLNEMETAVSFLYFKEKNCDFVLLECGKSGRSDTTNIIKNTEVVVVTAIKPEHKEESGNTLEEIAKDKVGIVKPGCSVITCLQSPEVLVMIRKECRKYRNLMAEAKYFQGKVLESDGTDMTFEYLGRKLMIHGAGVSQLENAVLAVGGIQALIDRGYKIEEKDIRKGFEEVKF